MLKFIFIFLILSSALATHREEAQAILAKYQHQHHLLSRMSLFSKSFLGLPYGEGGPLGEGPLGRYDQDPLYRFDTFDCTTYVETVIALALNSTGDVNDFEKNMDEIRYERGEVTYLKRNHFPSLQWIPHNVENGILEEINDFILPAHEQRVAEAIINLPGWLKAIKLQEIRVPLANLHERQNLLAELQSMAGYFSPVTARLNYIPISTLLARPALLKLIPDGAVINFVRPNWDLTNVIGTHMNVSHQGLVFHEKGKVVLRHASTGSPKLVTEILLLDYLKKFENHPTLKGIHLMKLTRAQAL
jgi:hypothetical protein